MEKAIVDTIGQDTHLTPNRSATRVTQFGPWLMSAMLHAAVLMILAACIIPMKVAGVMFATVFNPGEHLGADAVDIESPLDMALLDDQGDTPNDQKSQNFNTAVNELLLSPADSRLASRVSATFDSLTQQQSASSIAGQKTQVDHAASIAGAVDRITGQIRGQLQDSDLLVVWLLDASNSLVDDRQRVADRLEPFFHNLAQGRDGRKHQLLNAVVSFGAEMTEWVAPTEFSQEIVQAVKDLPVDQSGEEQVFGAITRCVTKYRRRSSKTHIMLVVWTDETGDDDHKLESTIQLCRKHSVSVSVVGPSSVLGAETGLHAYRDPKSKRIYQLPIRRGPDTAVPERLHLGYWFQTPPPRWMAKTERNPMPMAQPTGLPSWYGDRDLQGLVSGLSPYALTRLARETGGGYTIFDRPQDRGPFDMQLMRKYLPDYVSESEYRAAIANHPLRRAVLAAVAVTGSTELRHPKLALFGRYSKVPPYLFERFYFTPEAFRQKVKSNQRVLKRDAVRKSGVIDRALAAVSRDGQLLEGLDAAYANETSPRWKAWYDLTRGRLLATSVRLEEYRLSCDELTREDFWREDSNHLLFKASRNLRSGAEFRSRADQARMLLQRCVSEHPDTPWAYLAQRELAYPLGINLFQTKLHPTGFQRNVRPPSLPNF